VAGLLTHYPGEPWRFFIGGRWIVRLDAFGRVNLIGLAAILIAALLLALSNDWSLRRLGSQRWKALQRLNYVLLGLSVLHAVLFLREESRGFAYLILILTVFGIVTATQAAGIWRRRMQRLPKGEVSGSIR
jgi:sulfoxide reductase heme-binding subunit YedZ